MLIEFAATKLIFAWQIANVMSSFMNTCSLSLIFASLVPRLMFPGFYILLAEGGGGGGGES